MLSAQVVTLKSGQVLIRFKPKSRPTAVGSPRCWMPGVLAYGSREKEVVASAQALALRVLADRIEEHENSR
jgi:hypothetical protein